MSDNIIEKLKDSYYTLYDKYGIHPNAWLISTEYLSVLMTKRDYLEFKSTDITDSYRMLIMGLPVCEAIKPQIAKAIIMEDI